MHLRNVLQRSETFKSMHTLLLTLEQETFTMAPSNNIASRYIVENVHTQDISMRLANGSTIEVSMVQINKNQLYISNLCILYASQLGACFVMLVVLVVLTEAKRRKSPTFILNVVSLIFGFVRALLLLLFFTGPLVDFYNLNLPFDIEPEKSIIRTVDTMTQVGAVVLPLLMTISVLSSLAFQTYITAKDLFPNKSRYVVITLSVMIVLTASVFRAVQMGYNAKAVKDYAFFDPKWLRMSTLISNTGAIWWFSIIFNYKLVKHTLVRRRMGWKSLGPMRVISICASCTMIIPCKLWSSTRPWHIF